MISNYANTLKRIKLFEGISDSELLDVLKCLGAEETSYNKDEFIVRAGDELKHIGIILDGSVAVIKENITGNRMIMTILSSGDMFGEMVAYSRASSWPATVQAQSDCAVVFLSRERIVEQCEKTCLWHSTIIKNMLAIISERAMMLNRKLEYLTIKSMRGKLCAFFLEQKNKTKSLMFSLPMNRNELADFLNVSRPSMSREMIKMKEEGIIDFHLNTIKIINEEGLLKE